MSASKTLASIAAPAPEVVEQPVEQKQHQSAKQKARFDSGLAETHVDRVRVDGLVSRLRQSLQGSTGARNRLQAATGGRDGAHSGDKGVVHQAA